MIDRTLFRVIPGVLVALLLAGCGSGSDTGPGEIHWDRQTCEHCQMVISERRHAVQIRKTGVRRTHAFDDLGCALLWLDEQGLLSGSEEGLEVWARASADGEWVDARTAHFEAGLTTPMAYGFGVAERGMSFDEVQTEIIETERRRRSGASNRTNPLGQEDDHEKMKGEDVD